MSQSAIVQSRLTNPALVGLETGLVVLIGLAFALKFHLVFTLNVNWDEFYFLALMHDYLRGTLTNPLQTMHVHFFTWLPWISENEVEQVIAARISLLGLAGLSCSLTYLIGRRFVSRPAALFAVLCYLSFSLSVEHQTSFRADPLGAFLFLVALGLWLCLKNRRWSVGLAGAAIGCALMITIKSVFFIPVFGALFLYELKFRESRRSAIQGGLVFSLGLIVTFAVLFLLHRESLAVPDPIEASGYLRTSATKVFLWHDLFPRWPYLARSFMEDAVIWLFILAGVIALLVPRHEASTIIGQRPVTMLFFLLPLASLAIYRNAFPYFYVFILSPAILLCGVAFDSLLGNRGRLPISSPRIWLAGVITAIVISFGKHYITNNEDRTVAQREIVGLVHELFPEPAPYIDRSSMISSYPKQGFFMSSWGMESYRAAGRPIFEALVRDRRPLFLIVNSPSLDPSLSRSAVIEAGGHPLMEADAAVLRANYIHHWGALYVAGKALSFQRQGLDQPFEIMIPGVYTLESDGPVTIDGGLLEPGSRVVLRAGGHVALSHDSGVYNARLRWGDNLRRPSMPPSDMPIFAGF